MRICLITPELPPYVYGGIGYYVRDLAEHYAELGESVSVCGFDIHPQEVEEHHWGRSRSLPSPVDLRFARLEQKTIDFLANVPGAWRIADKLRARRLARRCRNAALVICRFMRQHQHEFDVVEIPNWPGHGAYLTQIEPKLVVRLSSPTFECGTQSKAVTTLEAATCRNADLVIGNSTAVVQKVTEPYRLDASTVRIIRHGVKDFKYPEIDRESKKLEFLYVGRSEIRKGTDILIQALSTIIPEFPSFRISFVGLHENELIEPFGELRTLWNSISCRHKDQIKFCGRVTEQDKLRIYAQSHWTIIPSRFESFGLVAIESLRAGTPFIAAANGAWLKRRKLQRDHYWCLQIRLTRGLRYCRKSFEKDVAERRHAVIQVDSHLRQISPPSEWQ